MPGLPGCVSSSSEMGRALCLSINNTLKQFGGIEVTSKGLTCILVCVIYSVTPVPLSFRNQENAFKCWSFESAKSES